MEYNSEKIEEQIRSGQLLTHKEVMQNLALIDAVKKLNVEPKYARNIRGRLAAVLHLLDEPQQALLCCDYAEHVVWICEERFPKELRYRHAIAETRRFIQGQATTSEVAQARLDLYKAMYELPDPDSLEVQAILEAIWSVNLAIRVCCQRQLEALGAVIRIGHQPRVEAVATKASYAVGHHAGAEDWNSADPKLKAAARKRGKRASDAETQWQMNRLLESIGYPCYNVSQEGLKPWLEPKQSPLSLPMDAKNESLFSPS